jgi:hypothetical protein
VKVEALLFAGLAGFFAVAGGIYDVYAKEPAGKAALALCFLMAALIAFFLSVQYRRHGSRAQDSENAEIVDAAGPIAFFSPGSAYPPLAAVGAAALGAGVVYGVWLCLIGAALLAAGVIGMMFQYPDR